MNNLLLEYKNIENEFENLRILKDESLQRYNEMSNDIVEIMGVIALFGYLNRWNDVMATTLEDDANTSGEDLLKGISWVPGKHA